MTSAQVEQFLSQLNDAWLEQDYPTLESLYHSDVVLLPPDAGDPIEGRDAVCEAYREFHALCSVQRFAITGTRFWNFSAAGQTGPQTDCTTVHMHFAIDYQLRSASGAPDTPQSEIGLEVYSLLPGQASAATPPQIIWRAQFAL